MDARPQPPPDDGREPQPRQIIRLADVEVRLPSRAGPVEILRGCNLVVSAGEAIGLVGPSGSGKTTLLMVIAGLETVTAGRVEVCGQDLTRLDEDGLARFRRDHVGVIFQSFHLIPAMTAWENVAVPLEFRGISGAMDIARQELTRVGLGHRLQHYPGQLSGGEQQRVAIARAMAAGAAVILADEPTGISIRTLAARSWICCSRCNGRRGRPWCW